MPDERPRYSVCIRAHRRREGLRRAIESALAQDTDDLEVVVSDDSGELADVVTACADPRVSYHRGPPGSIANLRHVSGLARGEMVVVDDDDDRLLPGFHAAAGEPMRRDGSLGVVFTGFLREAGGGRRPYDFPVPAGRVEAPARMILRGDPPGRSATLIRRTALEQGEAAYPLLDDHIGDLTTWLRTAAVGWGFWAVPEPHAITSVHRGQLSASEEPARMIRTLERFERLWKTMHRSKRSWPRLNAAFSSECGGVASSRYGAASQSRSRWRFGAGGAASSYAVRLWSTYELRSHCTSPGRNSMSR